MKETAGERDEEEREEEREEEGVDEKRAGRRAIVKGKF